MPFTLTLLFFMVGIFAAFPKDGYAMTIASQTQDYSSQLNVWQVIQELGDNLNGTLDKFTFRVRTFKSHLEQFYYTAENTRIFDKTDNTATLVACVPPGSDPNDKLRGLSFSTAGVPAGFEDVTLDFSCHNYNFIPGHRYLIRIISGYMINLIQFAAAAYGTGGAQSNDLFTAGGVRYGNGNPYDYVNNGGSCDTFGYIWNSQSAYKGCIPFTTPKDDLYFVLTNTAPPPKTPVIFIPGIGGSELKASQDIIWSAANGHGGTYSHGYAGNEKIWVNQDEASKLGDDDYFDVLRLKADGSASEADLTLTGNLSSQGYGEIDSFFTGLGYIKGTNYFVFPYDWRKDIRESKDSLDNLVEQAKSKSGQSKVNIVSHSMGGLIARHYISDPTKAAKINKLIELGVPHLGALDSLKSLMYGIALKSKVFGILPLGIPASETKDTSQNMTSIFQLLPSNKYFTFYDNSNSDLIFPFKDDRDIDNNKITGVLNYDQTKSLLSNLSYNMTVFGTAEQFHSSADPILNQTNGVTIYEIVGTAQPTLGQIHETWWISWPVNLINKTDEIYINGDDTVPLYSASLKNDSTDISGASKIYYVEQSHSALVSANGTAMQTVKSILETVDLPVEVKGQKLDLEGHQLSLDDGELELYDDSGKHTGLNDNGEIETNIADTFYSTSGKTKHVFIKKKASKVKVRVTRKSKSSSDPKYTNLKIRVYKHDKISKTTVYKDVPISTQTAKIEFSLDPSSDTSPTLTYFADAAKDDSSTIISTSEVSGASASDQTPPETKNDLSGSKNASGVYSSAVTVTLTATDSQSGILKTEYSLDNGATVQTYTAPFTISTTGKTTLQIKSIDKTGNEEMPQSQTIEIEASPSPTPTPSPIASSSSSSGNSSSTTSTSEESPSTPSIILRTSPLGTSKPFSEVSQNTDLSYSTPSILGISFENPGHISDQINVEQMLDKQNQSDAKTILTGRQMLGGLLTVSAGTVILASVGLLASFTLGGSSLRGRLPFVKPFPK